MSAWDYLPLTLVPGGTIAAAATDLGGLGIPISQLTPAGLLAVLILLIALGRLVPRRTMEDVIHDRDEWRSAHRISEQGRVELAETVEAMLEQMRTTNAVLHSITGNAQVTHQGPGQGASSSPTAAQQPD